MHALCAMVADILVGTDWTKSSSTAATASFRADKRGVTLELRVEALPSTMALPQGISLSISGDGVRMGEAVIRPPSPSKIANAIATLTRLNPTQKEPRHVVVL